MKIAELSVEQRITLSEVLWVSVASQDKEIEITDAQKVELERRLNAMALDQDLGDH